jgi:SAM-dependent methyltransferase
LHKLIFWEFQAILAQRLGAGFSGRVLEVGAVPTIATLLHSPILADAERVGINLDGPYDYDGCRIVRGNANHMPQFSDEAFDLVLSNATLEHDPQFWLTATEMRRVLRPDGTLVVGVPGFTQASGGFGRLVRKALIRTIGNNSKRMDWLVSSTPTYRVHNAPGDYYRFSTQAVRDVLFAGMADVTITSVMTPPRLIASGVKH